MTLGLLSPVPAGVQLVRLNDQTAVGCVPKNLLLI